MEKDIDVGGALRRYRREIKDQGQPPNREEVRRVTMMTDREKAYEALADERIDNLFTEYFMALNEAPHDAKEEVMILDALKDDLGSLAMAMFARGKDTGQLCPNCKQEIIDEAYLNHYGSICQKCGYDFLC